jgi:hypothetical protein
MLTFLGILLSSSRSSSVLRLWRSRAGCWRGATRHTQVPTVYLERLQSVITDNDNRLMYHSMVLVLDDVVGNVTRSMKEAQLWDSTIFVLSSDNVPPNPPLYQAQKSTVMGRKAT